MLQVFLNSGGAEFDLPRASLFLMRATLEPMRGHQAGNAILTGSLISNR